MCHAVIFETTVTLPARQVGSFFPVGLIDPVLAKADTLAIGVRADASPIANESHP
jgi:hypothetical protein